MAIQATCILVSRIIIVFPPFYVIPVFKFITPNPFKLYYGTE